MSAEPIHVTLSGGSRSGVGQSPGMSGSYIQYSPANASRGHNGSFADVETRQKMVESLDKEVADKHHTIARG